MKKLLIVLLSACTWWACDKGDDGAPSSIVLTGGSGDQTIYADETSVNGGQGIAFEAAEAWYAEVSEVQAKASSGEVDWADPGAPTRVARASTPYRSRSGPTRRVPTARPKSASSAARTKS